MESDITEEDGDNLQTYETLICNVIRTVLQNAYTAASKNSTDDGAIILQPKDFLDTLALSGLQLYFQLNSMQGNSMSMELTWTDVAILNTPKDVFLF